MTTTMYFSICLPSKSADGDNVQLYGPCPLCRRETIKMSLVVPDAVLTEKAHLDGPGLTERK